MNKFFLVLVALSATMATTLKGEIQFSSDEVTVQDGEISLKGEVKIQHDIGTLTANEASITQGAFSNTPSFLSACLNSAVEFYFSSNQVLQCEHANVDFIDKTATLWSTDKEIFFFDPDRKMSIQSKNVECKWEDDGISQEIKSLFAKHSVQISLGSDIYLNAQNALFVPDKDEKIYGTLSVNQNCANKPCYISIGEDILKAESASYEMKDEVLNLSKPIGKISTNASDSAHEDEVSFTSNLLSWDHKSGKVSLKEQILVDSNIFGYVTAKESLKFSTEKVDERVLFKGFTATGESRVVTHGGMTFVCDGTIDYNQENKTLVARAKSEPITYQKNELEIQADVLIFDRVNGDPRVVSFHDNVQFTLGDMKSTAGGLTYRPEEHTLEFFSSDTQNVVFYNKGSDTKMCADAITIIRDPITGESTIQGHGIVKLIFDHKLREQIIEVVSSCVKQPF